jgi:hypothetical protein
MHFSERGTGRLSAQAILAIRDSKSFLSLEYWTRTGSISFVWNSSANGVKAAADVQVRFGCRRSTGCLRMARPWHRSPRSRSRDRPPKIAF